MEEESRIPETSEEEALPGQQTVTVTAEAPGAMPPIPKKKPPRLSRTRWITVGLSALIGVLAVLAVIGVALRLQRDKAAADCRLTVSFIDVGQGDAALLESDGEYMLIDAGGDEAHAGVVTDFLKDAGVKELALAAATHPHADHIQDLPDIAEDFPIDTFLMPDLEYDSAGYARLLSELEEEKIPTVYTEPGQTYTLGSCTVEILGPVSTESEDLNDCCAVIRVVCGETSFLFTGDCTEAEERTLLESGQDLSADVLKVGHHGSEYSSCEDFLKAVDPDWAVISCGADNEYGHPHQAVLDRLKGIGAAVYRTDTQGTIIAQSDGLTVTFSSKQ